jgi:hypothetical protein
MGDELVEHPLEMRSPEDEHPVQTLSAGGPDEPLRLRVRTAATTKPVPRR